MQICVMYHALCIVCKCALCIIFSVQCASVHYTSCSPNSVQVGAIYVSYSLYVYGMRVYSILYSVQCASGQLLVTGGSRRVPRS